MVWHKLALPLHQNKGIMENLTFKKTEDQSLCELAYLIGKKNGSEEIRESVRETAEEVVCFSF